MKADTPLEIQWFAKVLADDGVMDDASAQALREELNNTDDLAVFAEAVIERLCEGMSDEEAQDIVDQIQQVVDYACEQAGSGAAPAAADYSAEDDNSLHFDDLDVDLSGLSGYEDLPSLSDTEYLSDEELQERMILLLTCLSTLG